MIAGSVVLFGYILILLAVIDVQRYCDDGDEDLLFTRAPMNVVFRVMMNLMGGLALINAAPFLPR